MHYNRELKKQLCEDVCFHGKSTLKTANDYNIPIKTFEKWITAFNKDKHCFDPIIELSNDFKSISKPELNNYDNFSNKELKNIIMKKDIEIARLKKAYTVKEGGMEKKVFVTFSKKNMK